MTHARQARLAAGITIEAAARHCRISPEAVRLAERDGGRVGQATAERLGRLYGIDALCFRHSPGGSRKPARQSHKETRNVTDTHTSPNR